MKLRNKKVLITGATSGIGLKLVERLYQHNQIYIIARNKDKISELKKSSPLVRAFVADLSDLDSVNNVTKEILLEVDQLDLLINNAAVQYTPTFIDSDFDYHSITEEITINFSAICCLTYLLLPVLKRDHKATILNVNSALGIAPKKTSAVYCATKAALNNFSLSLRYQLETTNIEVLQAFLPLVDTPMTKGRGSNKMSVETAAKLMIMGVENSVAENNIGKTRLLRILNRLSPSLAKSIMRKS
ncbi:MAG: SDR family NAD(P)-dependent oxidoreductase [Kangiellaceae bacterium]|nr:SDR family NAD(P)-dependent oxidoreductase [Kangiellaceae bacterium]MCW8999325.1 SDR family NAD(P)-dependent oxidoreductase [Kangiellaceae bacterium]